jgi:hypothetical protein
MLAPDSYQSPIHTGADERALSLSVSSIIYTVRSDYLVKLLPMGL